MALLEDLAEELSADCYKAMQEFGDDRLHERVAASIGALSPTLEEAFQTAMRLRLAEKRGRQFLNLEISRLKASQI